MSRRVKRRREHDYYPTPQWVVRNLLDNISGLSYSGEWLEPSVGDGAIVRAVDGVARENGTAIDWTTIDVREECEATFRGRDFIGWASSREPALRPFDVSILNPPYSQAEAHVFASIMVARTSIALLRLGFLQAECRASFIRETNPGVFVVPHRISFDGHGNDEHAHAWFVFGMPDFAGRLVVLPNTPLDVRKAEAAATRERLRMLDLERAGQQRLTLVHGARGK